MKIIAITALLLGGCSAQPVIRDRVHEALIPTPVYPVDPAKLQAMPKPLPPRPESSSAAADLLLAKVCEWVAYGLATDPLARAGSGQPPVAADFYPECAKR